MTFEIVTIPCLADNYAFLLHDTSKEKTALFDAPEALPVARALREHSWNLDAVFLTHHHYDHIDALPELQKHAHPQVIGAAADASRLPALDLAVSDGDLVEIGEISGQAIDVSGHTVGHVAYYFAKARAAFTGDSLMALGCGRLFEGSAETMWQSLSKLAALPPETRIFSGHEYTAANAKFALTIEPKNAALHARIAEIQSLHAKGIPTVPSTLALELATNPFLRANLPETKTAMGMIGASDVEVFAKIRKLKDNF